MEMRGKCMGGMENSGKHWSGGTEEVTSRYRILLDARPRSGIGGGRGRGELRLRACGRASVRASGSQSNGRKRPLH